MLELDQVLASLEELASHIVQIVHEGRHVRTDVRHIVRLFERWLFGDFSGFSGFVGSSRRWFVFFTQFNEYQALVLAVGVHEWGVVWPAGV